MVLDRREKRLAREHLPSLAFVLDTAVGAPNELQYLRGV